jgi:hypothetical protein
VGKVSREPPETMTPACLFLIVIVGLICYAAGRSDLLDRRRSYGRRK